MSGKSARIHKLLSLLLLLPLYGCNGGGGGGGIAGLVGSLLSGGSAGGTGGGTGGEGGLLTLNSIPPVGGENVATLTNPEPASMLLIGGGMMAMAYMKNRKK